jgi:NAD(P)-dependent dehydrogenase (short-subunit alcohol dehydrogenase family)
MSSQKHPFSLEGQTALITGGGSGIGAAIASAMVDCGAQVILVGRREAQLQEQTTALGNQAHYVVHDIIEFDRAKELIERAETRFGPITCLVNNAGIHIKKPAVETSIAEFRQVLDTHILGAHALTCALAPRMIDRGQGSILFTASMASLFGIPMVVAYSAAKSAMLGVVRTLATEFSPHGVRVNAIAPGWIETAMSRKAMDGDPVRKNKILNRTPMARFGTPEDIAWAAVYLSSDAARFVTGVTLPVDGGISIGF